MVVMMKRCWWSSIVIFFLLSFDLLLPLSSKKTNSSVLSKPHKTPTISHHNHSTSSPRDIFVDCNLCQYPFVIILGTSTSSNFTSHVMNVVNKLPRVDLAGEHNGILSKLFTGYNLFSFTSDAIKRTKDGTAWSGRAISKKSYLCWLQHWFLISAGHPANFTAADIHGFQEFRYANDIQLMQFLAKDLFPCAKFVLCYQTDIIAHAENNHQNNKKKNKKNKKKNKPVTITPAMLIANETWNLKEFTKQHKRQVFTMSVERGSQVAQWNALFSFLHRSNCTAKMMADQNYSSNNSNSNSNSNKSSNHVAMLLQQPTVTCL